MDCQISTVTILSDSRLVWFRGWKRPPAAPKEPSAPESLRPNSRLSRIFEFPTVPNLRESSPAALGRLGYRSEQWTRQMMAVGSNFNRALGQAESLVQKALEIGQFWLRGVSVARALSAKTASAN